MYIDLYVDVVEQVAGCKAEVKHFYRKWIQYLQESIVDGIMNLILYICVCVCVCVCARSESEGERVRGWEREREREREREKE